MIVVVAGITRSGLSLTMQMLNAGGYPCAGHPPAFEPYAIGRIPWGELDGKAVKLVDAHNHLPPPGDYLVIRLRRDMREQAMSFNKWSAAFGMDGASVSRLVHSFQRDYAVIDEWAKRQRALLLLDFKELITAPMASAERIEEFVGQHLDTTGMSEVVVPRDPRCYPTLLETKLVELYR